MTLEMIAIVRFMSWASAQIDLLIDGSNGFCLE